MGSQQAKYELLLAPAYGTGHWDTHVATMDFEHGLLIVLLNFAKERKVFLGCAYDL